MSADGLLWDAYQHRLLAAMGLHVLAHVDAAPWPAPVAAAAAPDFENLAPARPSAPSAPAPVAPRRAAPAPLVEVAPAAVGETVRVPSARSVRGGGLLPDRLLLALSRAAALNPADPADQALMAGWQLDQLRASPAAKRALWPQLRSLRKQRRNR